MTSGLTRREGAQDNLAGQANVEPVQINGPSISGPRGFRPPDHSAQERIVNQLSQWSMGKLVEGMQKKQRRDMRDGQMAYQQGETLEQVEMGGNKWALEGYRLMDAQTISSSMLAAQREEIAQNSHTLDPDAYRERYINRMEAMLDGVDPRTAELVEEQMAAHMPTLVADHTAAHMAYMEGENYASLERSIDVVSRDPTATDVLVDFARGGEDSASAGLSDARRQAATVSGVVRAFDNDNPLAYSALAKEGLLGDNLTTDEQNKIKAAQQRFENRRRSEYNEVLFNGEQELLRQVERAELTPTEAVERMSTLYAEHGINMTQAEAGAIYSPALQSQRTANLEATVLLEDARLRGDFATMARITAPIIEHVESGGDPNAVGPVILGGANKGDQARGSMQVMPKTMRDPGYGVVPAQNDTAEEYARVGRDYWAAMVKRHGGDIEAAAVAYNAGPGNADAWLEAGRDYSVLPDQEQTQDYTKKVMTRLGNWKAPTAADKLAIAQQQLNTTRQRLALDTYEQIAPKLADTDDQFTRGEITEGAWRERRDHLYAEYDYARTAADVNHEIGITRSVDDALTQQAKTTADAAYKLALESAQAGLVPAQMARDEVINDPESTPDQIRAANEGYIQERNAVFDQFGIKALDRGNGDAAEAMYRSTYEAIKRNQKHTEDGAVIDHAVAMGYLSDLSPELQERAFEDAEREIAQSIQEAVASKEITEEQAPEFYSQQMNDFIASSGVADPKLRSRLSAAMRMPLLDKDGNPNPSVIQTVEQYADIKAKNPRAALTLLNEQERIRAEAILAKAQNPSLIGEGVRALGLETKENPLRQDSTEYLARPDVIRATKRVVDDFLDTRDIGWLHALWQSDARWDQRWDNSQSATNRIQSDEMRTQIGMELENEVARLQGISPEIKPAELVQMAGENLARRAEIIGGNPVIMQPGYDVRQSFFGDRANDFMHDGDVNSAVMEWLRSDAAQEQYPELDDFTMMEHLPGIMQGAIGLGARALGMEIDPALTRNEMLDANKTGVRPFVAYAVKGDVVISYLRPNGSYSDPIVVPAREAGAAYMKRRQREMTE